MTIEYDARATNLPPEIVRLLHEEGAQIPISSVKSWLPEEMVEMI